MNDRQIVTLYWARSENALSETAAKYGNYCHTIAFHILENQEDSEECVNDTYLRAWHAIPPARPRRLSTFLGKITRNLALDRYRRSVREKRGGGQAALALEELQDCVPGRNALEETLDALVLTQILNDFLAALSAESRVIFLRRYWYFLSIQEIAAGLGVSESKVKMSLLRSREALKARLEKEDISL